MIRGIPDPEPHNLERYVMRERRMAKKQLMVGGGQANPDPATHEIGRNFSRFVHRGDWVWPYAPVKP